MKLNQQMPELDGTATWFNRIHTREELLGKPTVFYFWSISCMVCKQAMPELVKTLKEYGDKINVISVHMPRSQKDQDMVEVEKVVQGYGIDQPWIHDDHHTITEKFENEYIPAHYVFNPAGELCHFGTSLKLLDKRITRLLEN
ncbi:thiol-disulfide isomerase [Bacillus phage SP-15]|uniref:Thiol-disulfide isomerase n=1 Tax=Bacillus phage SP-15 TaxID=1792032 RepID=A0A127AW88_9CAUD|nr:thiol-disulfide isomerase [Bacillus phage SP-15]AMM44900.1 thiol-disulfide isomerase [Bacillus phage SP-15]